MRVLGLDEAGRGCVLGPLVVGAFLWEGRALEGGERALRAAGANDSKALSPARREAARAALEREGEGTVVRIEAAAIDEGNINALEEDAFCALIQGHRPDAVYLDAPCNPAAIPKFAQRLRRRTGFAGVLTVEPKADATYAVVGAASIFAKVLRDAAIHELGTAGEVGSGYPSDPVTERWLRGFLDRGAPLPAAVRTRWGTIERLRQQRLFP